MDLGESMGKYNFRGCPRFPIQILQSQKRTRTVQGLGHQVVNCETQAIVLCLMVGKLQVAYQQGKPHFFI